MKLGRLGVWYFFDAMSSSEAATTAQKNRITGLFNIMDSRDHREKTLWF